MSLLAGTIRTLVLDSAALRDNALQDPSRREVPVYLPPGGARADLPVILVLAGFSGVGSGQLRGTPWEPSLPARFERLLSSGRAAPAVLVFPDCFTRFGGSQYMNSPATGRYEDYLVQDVLPAVEREFGCGGKRSRRGVIGKSSGGYGALHLSLQHPEVFSALASHSGDAAFDLCYRGDFPRLLAQLDRHATVEGFVAAFEGSPRKSTAQILAMNVLAMAAAYSPEADENPPFGVALPFEPRTGRLRPDVWARWLTFDPVERAAVYGEVLAGFSLVFLDAGLRDEYHLQYGARQLADALAGKGVAVHHEEFDDGHMGISYRYESSLPLVTRALSG